jgi:hypothetical protein
MPKHASGASTETSITVIIAALMGSKQIGRINWVDRRRIATALTDAGIGFVPQHTPRHRLETT